MLFAVMFDVLVYAFAKDLLLFGENDDDGTEDSNGYRAVSLQTFATNQQRQQQHQAQDGKKNHLVIYIKMSLSCFI